MPRGIPEDVRAINNAMRDFLSTPGHGGFPIGSGLGVYAFYDYDAEPIYVGQTWEKLSARIGRHMTNQRTDAVAMKVLDPFEVAHIEVWPMHYGPLPPAEKQRFLELLNAAEYTVFQKVLRESSFHAVLNEADIAVTAEIELPTSYKGKIIPEDIFESRSHPDIRIARRAQTIAALAQVISQRSVSKGLRRTLHTQARRLERLASDRLTDFHGQAVPVEGPGEDVGESSPEEVPED